MPKRIDLTGKQFGRLTVVGYAGKNKHGDSDWKCKCDCGNYVVVVSGNLRSGHTRSCGCLRSDTITEHDKKRAIHGMSRTKIYITWNNMKSRCMNPQNISYSNYGGRGITVCERWLSFENFIADMGPTYKQGLQLDRIDNNKGYSPDNCRWVTHKENQNNKRNNRRFRFYDNKTLAELSEESGISCETIEGRIKMGWPDERLLEPVRTLYKNHVILIDKHMVFDSVTAAAKYTGLAVSTVSNALNRRGGRTSKGTFKFYTL